MKGILDIKKIRESLKLTQDEFARKIGVCRATVNRWENNLREPSKLALKEIDRLIKKIQNKITMTKK